MVTARDNRKYLAAEVNRLTAIVESQEKTIKELTAKLTPPTAPPPDSFKDEGRGGKPWKKAAAVKDAEE